MDENNQNIPSTDISALFTNDLNLLDLNTLVAQKLRNNGIETVELLAQLTEPDLISIGLQGADAYTILVRARNYVARRSPAKIEFRDVSSWLKHHNLAKWIPHFENIPMSMIPFIRRSDLTVNLNIPMVDADSSLSRLWAAIQSLPFNLPPPIHHIDDSCELICTTSQLPVQIELNEVNFLDLLSHADKKNSSIKVSFLGDTGSGKSLTVMQLLTFDDRIRHGRGPLIASPGQLEATTGNVCYYQTNTEKGKHHFLLLDFEGAFGGTPKRLRDILGQQLGQLSNHHTSQITQLIKQREEVVKTMFPQLAYLISNIVVLIDKQPPHHTQYMEKLIKFAELSTKNSGPGEKPFLIIIQNFANPENQRDEHRSYLFDVSTEDFNVCIRQQQKATELLQHYRDICFVRLPSWNKNPELFDQQICSLQLKLSQYAEILKKESWFSKNFWSDYLWLHYLKALCTELKQSSKPVNIPRILVSLVQPQLSLLRRITNFWRLIWTPPIVGEEREPNSILDNWTRCCGFALERFAELVFEELQAPNLDNMLIRDSVIEAVKNFDSELDQHSPCLHRVGERGVCGTAKRLHTTGHYGQKTGEHEGPKFQTDTFAKVMENIKRLNNIDSRCRAEQNLALLQTGLSQKTQEERTLLLQQWIPFCFVCLRNFEKSRPLRLLSCSHVVCDECSHLIQGLSCPIHRNLFSFSDFKKKVPGYANPRVLSLDGGGVRGIILLRILDFIEKRTEYKIKELFDLIVGTEIGGVIALLVSIANEPVANHSQLILTYPPSVYKGNFLSKLGIWSKSKYKSKTIEAFAKKLFGDSMTMTGICKPENSLVAVTAFRTTSTTWDPVFFTNYIHESGLSEAEEYSGRKIVHNCYVWQAAATSLAVPSLFRPQSVGDDDYLSGLFVAANPSLHATQEAAHIWKRSAEYVISVGTGYCQKTPRKDEIKLHWAKRDVELPIEVINSEVKSMHVCDKYRIYYARLNPDMDNAIKIDSTSQNDIQILFNAVATYLNNHSEDLKKVCQRLVAALLYVAEIRSMESDKSKVRIVIRCRQPQFHVSVFLGGPNWQLSCLKFSGSFTTRIVYDPNRTQNPVAVIYVEQIGTGSSLGIDIVLGTERYPISGGGYITFSPVISTSLRPLNHQHGVANANTQLSPQSLLSSQLSTLSLTNK
jgi:hypothetical protein